MATSPNFAFLEVHDRELVEISSLAERYFAEDPNTCLLKLRQLGELLAQLVAANSKLYLYASESQLDLLKRLERENIISGLVVEQFHRLRKAGNDAMHARIGSHRLALSHLRSAYALTVWFHQTFGDCSFVGQPFVPPPDSPQVPEGVQSLIAELSKKAQVNRREAESAKIVALEESARRAEAEAIAAEFQQKLEALQVQAMAQPIQVQQAILLRAQVNVAKLVLDEDEIRILIDQQLVDLGWEADSVNLRYAMGVRPEVGRNMAIAEYSLSGKRVDYALFVGGRLLGVLEAKAKNAVKAQVQTEFYVKTAAGIYNTDEAPFAFFSDYYTSYFWQVGDTAKRMVAGLFAPKDLERLDFIRQHGTSLAATRINTKIAGRAYQQEAIRRVCEAFEDGKRRALLVMATGTGKTRTAMALVELFLQTQQAQRVLFVADRDALVKQALEDGFQTHLPDEPCDRIVTRSIDKTKRLYAVTKHTLERCYQEFSPAFFDLIIFDEAHRSLFNRFAEVVDYFDARMIGLTATPASFIERNTFRLFHCDDIQATFLYSYEDAVKEKILVDYSLYRAQTHFQRQGIRGIDLSEDEQAALIEQGIDPDDLDFSNTELEKTVTNWDTLRRQWEEILEVCFKDEAGQYPAKTIVFAMTQGHAQRLCEVFEAEYSQYSDLVRVITHETEYKGLLVKGFKTSDMPRIAISVDMLDTGVDVPEVMNLVFMRPVQSYIKLMQMIGRGTRSQETCKKLHWLPNGKKTEFKIIDFWENDFNKTPTASEAQELPILVRLFNTRLQILSGLLTQPTAADTQRVVKDVRSQIAQIPTEAFSVRKHWSDIQKVWTDNFWRFLKPKDIEFLKLKVGPLLRFVAGVDVAAATFTHKIERLKVSQLKGQPSPELIGSIVGDVQQLPPFVHEEPHNQPAIELCFSGQLSQATLAQLTGVAETLAGQMRLKQSEHNQPMRLNLLDRMAVQEYILLNDGQEQVYVEVYKERVLNKVLDIVSDHPAIRAIEQGQEVEDAVLIDLERQLRQELGGKELELSTDNIRKAYRMKVNSFLAFVRELLEFDALPEYGSLVQKAFEKFIGLHQFTGDQILFLRAVQSVFLRNRRLELTDLYDERSLQRFGKDAVDRLFTNNEVRELISFTQEIAA
jgi:type I restriction enzyme, R subunit